MTGQVSTNKENVCAFSLDKLEICIARNFVKCIEGFNREL